MFEKYALHRLVQVGDLAFGQVEKGPHGILKSHRYVVVDDMKWRVQVNCA